MNPPKNARPAATGRASKSSTDSQHTAPAGAGQERWRRVTKAYPCPACGKPDWCGWTPDGELLKCERVTEAPAGMILVKAADGGALFKYCDAIAPRPPKSPGAKKARTI